MEGFNLFLIRVPKVITVVTVVILYVASPNDLQAGCSPSMVSDLQQRNVPSSEIERVCGSANPQPPSSRCVSQHGTCPI